MGVASGVRSTDSQSMARWIPGSGVVVPTLLLMPGFEVSQSMERAEAGAADSATRASAEAAVAAAKRLRFFT